MALERRKVDIRGDRQLILGGKTGTIRGDGHMTLGNGQITLRGRTGNIWRDGQMIFGGTDI